MIQRYGNEIRLLENQFYTVTLQIQNETHTVSFTSQYNPLYSSVRQIRSDYRTLFEGYSNDDINRLIYQNSLLGVELSSQEIDPTAIPFALKQYVRYKTQLDLATDLFMSASSNTGQYDKQLGDLRISKQTQLPYIDSTIKILQQKVDIWEMQIGGTRAQPSSAVRGGATEFPLNARLF